MKKVLKAIIKFYQMCISPAKGTKCPYYPSCSCYGLEAIEKFGAAKGSVLAAWRVLRCNPFSKGGWDPVPEEFCIPRCGGQPIRLKKDKITYDK